MAERLQTHLKEIIRIVNEKFGNRFAAAQFNELSELYTRDGIVLPPNMEMIQGRDAIAGLWQALFNMGIQSMKLETVEVEDCGRLGVEVGLFKLYSADRHLLDQGKYVVVWENEDGEWKLHRDIFNSSLPVQK